MKHLIVFLLLISISLNAQKGNIIELENQLMQEFRNKMGKATQEKKWNLKIV